MSAEQLAVNQSLVIMAMAHFRDRLQDREKGIAGEDEEYRVSTSQSYTCVLLYS